VKVADLRDNLRNNKSLTPTPSVLERIERYEQALSFLQPKLITFVQATVTASAKVDESWVVLADPEGNEFCVLAGRRP
jgi:hypothetical protein